jgi:hypothetical protein
MLREAGPRGLSSAEIARKIENGHGKSEIETECKGISPDKISK